MKAENRIRKMEEATGINEPCVVCDVLNSELAEFYAWFADKSLEKLDGPRDLMPRVCHWCGKTRPQDVTHYTVNERALIERHDAAWFAGRLTCAPECKGLHDELLAMYEKHSYIQLGVYYEEGRAMSDAAVERMLAYIEENAPCPFYHYICTVEGCTCEYPKSEKEFQANRETNKRLREYRAA
ncbi:MAG: hypothetical protein WBP93_14020 [Pyrinomonadaceae bacterium]